MSKCIHCDNFTSDGNYQEICNQCYEEIRSEQSRYGKASELWQKANNKPGVTPDLGDLLKFLMDIIDRLIETNEALSVRIAKLEENSDGEKEHQ